MNIPPVSRMRPGAYTGSRTYIPSKKTNLGSMASSKFSRKSSSENSVMDMIKSFVYGNDYCSPQDMSSGNGWKYFGYLVAVIIVLNTIRYIQLSMNEKNRNRPMKEKITLWVLIGIQVLSAFMLYNHCGKCACWTGLWKGLILGIVGVFITQMLFGEEFGLQMLTESTMGSSTNKEELVNNTPANVAAKQPSAANRYF